MERVNIDELEFSLERRWMRLGIPFTGIVEQLGENGQLEFETSIENGVKCGRATEWLASGIKRVEEHFLNDVLHGTRREWHENGRLKENSEYEFGICLNRTAWNELGVKVEEFQLTSNDSRWKLLEAYRAAFGAQR